MAYIAEILHRHADFSSHITRAALVGFTECGDFSLEVYFSDRDPSPLLSKVNGGVFDSFECQNSTVSFKSLRCQ